MTRVAHVIAEYSAREAMGRTVAETAARVPGEHSLVTAVAHDGTDGFARVAALGGAVESFPLGRTADLAAALDAIAPDVVHVHGGALAPLLSLGRAVRGRPNVLTLYAWPTAPSPAALRRIGLRAATQSNVLRPRVAATTVLPAGAVVAATRAAGTSAVLTPDPRVQARLGSRLDVQRLGSGAPQDPRRARWDGRTPVVLFAGRAESVRGVGPLLRAFTQVRHRVPGARLRLLLLPRPELAALEQQVAAAGLGDAVDVVTTACTDLLGEMARAQVGVWPFLADYTTSPPAMAVVEALSVGLPVVGTRVGCIEAAATHGRGALLVQPGDAPALADALCELLTDPATWQGHAAAAPASVRHLSWERTAAVTAEAYERARAGATRRGRVDARPGPR